MAVLKRRGRDWCFTAFGEEAVLEQVIANLQLEKGVRYCILQREKCPETERLHLQGYIYFENARSGNGVSKLIGGNPHLEVPRGSPESNRVYCSKQESRVQGTEPVEWGVIPEQGKRSDLREAAEAVLEGARLEDIAAGDPTVVARYGRGLERLQRLRWRSIGVQRPVPKCVYLWGEPGVGKTRAVFDMFEPGEIFRPLDTGTRYWWDDYEPEHHRCVVFDDWDGSHSRSLMLAWLDRYPVSVDVKGGKAPLLAENIFITSNFKPSELGYPRQQLGAFLRRVEVIHAIDTGDTEVGGVILDPPTADLDDLMNMLDEL